MVHKKCPENLAGTTATHGGTFGATDLTAGGLSCEIGVALADAPRAVDAILQVAKQYTFGGTVALRFVRPSGAFLAFTKFAPYTCTIELPVVASNRSRQAYELIWNALEQQQIPHTFHWGQCMRPNPAQLRNVFGERLTQWLAARRAFLSPNGLRLFSNTLIQQWGIDQ